METMFYKITDYVNRGNVSAVAVSSGFASYIASHLFVKEKKKDEEISEWYFSIKKCLVLHANSKTQANLGFLGGE